MKLFPDGLIFKENNNLVFQTKIETNFKNLNILKSEEFLKSISELDAYTQAEIISMKPETVLCKIEKQIIDHKEYIYIKNFTEDRRKKVLVSIFMRVIFDKLKNSFNTIKNNLPENTDITDLLYETAMAENLVDQLYYFSSLNSGPLRLNTQLVNLENLVKKIILNIKSFYRKKIKINVSIEKNLPKIRIDHKKFEDVIMTLICNAMTYSDKDSPVELKIKKISSKSISISVKDRGRGMPSKILNKIFDKYYHVDRMINSGENVNRLSIGLPYLNYIIKAHGGSIKVDSKINNGTEFIITLPIDHVNTCVKIEEKKDSKYFSIKKENNNLKITIPSKSGYLSLIESEINNFLKNTKLTTDDLCSINLVISESLSNSIMHGPKEENNIITLNLILVKKGILFSIKDGGGRFFYPTFFEKLAKDRGMKAGGRGIFFMKHFMDEIVYLINPKKSTWLFMFKKIDK